MTNLENALKELANQTNDIFIIFYFTAGLLVILVIFWLLYKINEERFLLKRQLQDVENVPKDQNQSVPPARLGQRDLGFGTHDKSRNDRHGVQVERRSRRVLNICKKSAIKIRHK